MRLTILTCVFALLSIGSGTAGAQKAGAQKVATSADIVVRTVEGDYASVREAIEFAITNRGLVVDHVQHIGDMLARTGKDIGASKQVYTDANAFQFCSASISRETMEADPNNIAFCPYIVFAYTLPDQPKKVYVGYRRPPMTGSAQSKAALKKVEELLEGIVQEATSW